MAVIEGRDAGNVADLGDGIELLQIILARVEIGDGQRIGVVARLDIVGRARPMRRRRPVLVDRDRDGDDAVRRHGAEFRLIAAVDETARQMKQKIDETRRLAVAAEESRIEFFQLRPDPRQRGERRKERIEDGWTHRVRIVSGEARIGKAIRYSLFAIRPSIYPWPGPVRAFGVEHNSESGGRPVFRNHAPEKMRAASVTERSSAGLDERRRRLLFRAWRRGVREMDLIVGRFADARIDKFDTGELAAFERLIEVPNAELYAWIVGDEAVPAHHDTPVLRQLIAFHNRAGSKPEAKP